MKTFASCRGPFVKAMLLRSRPLIEAPGFERRNEMERMVREISERNRREMREKSERNPGDLRSHKCRHSRTGIRPEKRYTLPPRDTVATPLSRAIRLLACWANSSIFSLRRPSAGNMVSATDFELWLSADGVSETLDGRATRLS